MADIPAPLAAWYVLTTILLTGFILCSGQIGSIPMIVEQFGFAMTLLEPRAAFHRCRTIL
jgi:hypothetical protein